MQRNLLCVLALFLSIHSHAQLQVAEPDKSPMDMSYSPQGYPILKFQNKNMEGKLNARVIYSRPQVKGREIFGGEVKYNEVWRIGANESTEIDFYKPAVIAGKKIPKGRYTLFCIPAADKWTIILNRDTDSWGAFSYNQALDMLRTDIPVQKNETAVEYLTIYFDNGNNLVMMWADIKASLAVQFVNK